MELQDIGELKFIKESNVSKINDYLNSGWVLLEIYKFNNVYDYSEGKAITREEPQFLLGKKRISYVEKHLEEIRKNESNTSKNHKE